MTLSRTRASAIRSAPLRVMIVFASLASLGVRGCESTRAPASSTGASHVRPVSAARATPAAGAVAPADGTEPVLPPARPTLVLSTPPPAEPNATTPERNLRAHREAVGVVVPHTCDLAGSRRSVFGSAAAPAVVGLAQGYAIAAYVPGEAEMFAVVLTVAADGRAARTVTRFAVSPAIATTQLVPPAIARVGVGRIAVATVDAQRRLEYREIDLATGQVFGPIRIADGSVDTRFPPSIAPLGALRLVAFTRFGDPQRVEVVVMDDSPRSLRRHDVTPDSAGAASPTFVRDVTPPYLVFVDPREALSLTHAVSFDANGAPGEDDGLQPIIGLVTPARVVAALSPADLQIAFLAHGESNLMGSFVLASHASSITPRTLVASSDSARLWIDALGARDGVLTVSLAPHADEAGSPREAVVRVIDSAGIGPELRIAAVQGSAVYPMLARDDAGTIALVFGTASGIDFVPLRCIGG